MTGTISTYIANPNLNKIRIFANNFSPPLPYFSPLPPDNDFNNLWTGTLSTFRYLLRPSLTLFFFSDPRDTAAILAFNEALSLGFSWQTDVSLCGQPGLNCGSGKIVQLLVISFAVFLTSPHHTSPPFP